MPLRLPRLGRGIPIRLLHAVVDQSLQSLAGLTQAAAPGPFGDDMAKIAARYSPAELRVIADWIAVTTEALVADTQRIMGLDQEKSTVRSK
jgi:hypothetical protein